MTKKILDTTCGSRTIWFNKSHPAAIYCDARDEEYTGIWKSTNRDSERTCVVHPDIQCDFTDLPFLDNTFSLVVFDPPLIAEFGCIEKAMGYAADLIENQQRHIEALMKANAGLRDTVLRRDA